MDANELYKKYSENYMGTGSNKKLENYHQYRISSFVDLTKRHFNNLSVVIDYGCGDGVLKKHLVTENYFGIDPSDEMIRLARLSYGNSKIDFRCGGLKKLRRLCENSVSRFGGSYESKVLICLNTLPYMHQKEVSDFFAIAKEFSLSVIVSHTNELLDLVSCNRYTVEHRSELLPELELSAFHKKFKEMFSCPDSPQRLSQLEGRFGDRTINSSERDSTIKYRVDPFEWPNEIAQRYNLQVKEVQPIRIFAFPPSIMEADESTLALLHSDRFDALPDTYKKIFCSQFRVVFVPA